MCYLESICSCGISCMKQIYIIQNILKPCTIHTKLQMCNSLCAMQNNLDSWKNCMSPSSQLKQNRFELSACDCKYSNFQPRNTDSLDLIAIGIYFHPGFQGHRLFSCQEHILMMRIIVMGRKFARVVSFVQHCHLLQASSFICWIKAWQVCGSIHWQNETAVKVWALQFKSCKPLPEKNKCGHYFPAVKFCWPLCTGNDLPEVAQFANLRTGGIQNIWKLFIPQLVGQCELTWILGSKLDKSRFITGPCASVPTGFSTGNQKDIYPVESFEDCCKTNFLLFLFFIVQPSVWCIHAPWALLAWIFPF